MILGRQGWCRAVQAISQLDATRTSRTARHLVWWDDNILVSQADEIGSKLAAFLQV